MPREAPERSPEQQHEHDRLDALRTLNVTALRAYMRATSLEDALISDDDQLVLKAAHETRVIDPRTTPYLRRESRRWLRANYPESTALLTDKQIVKRLRG